MIDYSEVLTPADPFYQIAKNNFTIPFVCGCTNLGEAIRRVAEGAAMIRTKGEAGTGNVVSAVQHARLVKEEILIRLHHYSTRVFLIIYKNTNGKKVQY